MAYVESGYVAAGYVEAIAPAAGYPSPSDVKLGIVYGAASEYTGTYTGGTYPGSAQTAAAVRAEIAAELTRITELAQIHGLVAGTDLVVTPTTRTAGSVSQTISGDGVTSTTVHRV